MNFLKKIIMCAGIILKEGKHLHSIREIERHFNKDLSKYYDNHERCRIDLCTCQMDLESFMNEPEQKEKYYYEVGEYWER